MTAAAPKATLAMLESEDPAALHGRWRLHDMVVTMVLELTTVVMTDAEVAVGTMMVVEPVAVEVTVLVEVEVRERVSVMVSVTV
jgi:hypothetical protein